MAALTADRNTQRRTGDNFSRPVAAGVNIFAGALVVLNAAGYAEPGTTSTAVIADGRAEDPANNVGGANAAINVPVHAGIFLWDNSAGGDLIAQANVGATCYVVDDHTVALTTGGGTRSPAGKIVDTDPATGKVWVATGQVFPV